MENRLKICVILLIFLFLFTGCGKSEPRTAPASPTHTVMDAATTEAPIHPTATDLPTVAPSSTPAATATTQFTQTPEQTTPAFELIEGIAYVANGGPAQTLSLYLPREENRKPLTLLVLGGDGFPELVGHFSELGYPVVAFSARSNSYQAEIQDGFCALAWAHANASVYGFADRIIPVGGSMWGGNAAILGLVDDTEPFLGECPHSLPDSGRVSAVISLAGVFDYSERGDFFVGFIEAISGFMGGSPDQAPDDWAAASAITWVKGDEPPFLLVHGEADTNVAPNQSEKFAAALEGVGADVELVLLPGVNHYNSVSHPGVFEAIESYLERLEVAATPAATQITFVSSGQNLGTARSWDVDLGDLDNDGDLDVFVANDGLDGKANAVWFNDGQGSYTASDQSLGTGYGVTLGDLDGDGDLDALTTFDQSTEVWLNDGGIQAGVPGSFTQSDQSLDCGNTCFTSALGDFDSDGDLDAFLGVDGPNLVWLNDGGGGFQESDQKLGDIFTAAVSVGDLDLDGDLDVISGGWNGAVETWINDGAGTFAYLEQSQVDSPGHIHSIGLGDLDRDGDFDAIVTVASGGPNQVWLNDGTGIFIPNQSISTSLTHDVALGDLDGDDDLDAMIAVGTTDVDVNGNKVWFNDGSGYFSKASFHMGTSFCSAVALGDLDGDGDLDAFAAHTNWQEDQAGKPNRVWLNEAPSATPTTPPTDTPEPIATPTATEVPALIFSPAPGFRASLRTYGGGYHDFASDVLLLDDGGTLIVGRANTPGFTHRITPGNAHLIRTDSEGNIIWEKDFGGKDDAYFNSPIQTGEEEYVVLGGIAASYVREEDDMYLVKIDGEGNEIWSHTYGGRGMDSGLMVRQTTDGGFILVGHRADEYPTGGAYHSKIILIKTDSEGNEEWSQTYGKEFLYMGWGVAQTPDGGYVLAGWEAKTIDDRDVIAIKTNEAGKVQWSRTWDLDPGERDGGFDLILTSDEYVVIACVQSMNKGPRGAVLVKVDLDGNESWVKRYGEESVWNEFWDVMADSDGGYVMAGSTLPDEESAIREDLRSGLIIKTDPDGEVSWQHVISREEYKQTHFSSAVVLPDGGYIFVGTATRSDGKYKDMLWLKLTPDG